MMTNNNNNNNNVINDVGDDCYNNEQYEQSCRGLKKGPWMAAEDAILIEYVKKHGEGNWNAVQKNSGLARCGKSCRLRWSNHLRPNLKKGSFSAEEERIIIQLHTKLGNKWALMASQLSGRTDNEIKNYWNTRMKRLQRAGLPLYPHDIQQEASAFHLQQHHHHHHHQIRSSTNSPPSSFTSLLSPTHSQTPCLHEPINLPMAVSNTYLHNQSPSAFYPQPTDQLKLFSDHNGNGGVSYSFFQISPFGSSTQFNQSINPVQTSNLTSSTTLQYNYGNKGLFGQPNFSPSSMLAGGYPYQHSNDGALIIPTNNSLVTKLPSTQTTQHSTTTSANPSSNTSCGGHNAKDFHELEPQESQWNSGLLEAVIVEAHAISSRKDKIKAEVSLSGPYEKRRRILEDNDVQVESALKIKEDESHADHYQHQNQNDELTFPQTPIIGVEGAQTEEEVVVVEEMNLMDDDLMSLLHYFPATTTPTLSEWCPKREDNHFNKQSILGVRSIGSINTTNINDEVEQTINNIPHQVTSSLALMSPTVDRIIDAAACNWKNMSAGIC